ncbi:hypothetical protein [Sciscionella marina]|uniref:hypothetical protein n=1 Tax=Sciscionella marina TaxID=508770 RepID=UPI0012F6CBFC|nr:hypothetical protein [Sciscionella marina]
MIDARVAFDGVQAEIDLAVISGGLNLIEQVVDQLPVFAGGHRARLDRFDRCLSLWGKSCPSSIRPDTGIIRT